MGTEDSRKNQVSDIHAWLSQVIIRHVTDQDLVALEWDGQYSHFRRVYQEAYQRAVRGHSVLWLAEIQQVGVIGQTFVQLTCDRPELADGRTRGYIYAVRVREEYRNRGIGTRLMDVAEDDLRSRGFTLATLNVARNNRDAQRLYQRRGYRIIAFEPGKWSYPDDKGTWQSVVEPAWRMEKRLA